MERLACDALLLACNGFGGNAAMVRELLPEMRDALFAGHAGNDGSAIAWGRRLGARLADLGGYQGHGSWAVPQGALMSWALMMEGGVQVNAEGRRFHDETQGYSEAAVQVLAQPGGIAWNVFDARLLALARDVPGFREAEAAGALRPLRHVAALAALHRLRRRDARRARCAGTAPRLPPYARRCAVTGALFHTQGGLDIDARMPRAARRRHAVSQPARRRRRGARRLGQRGLGLSVGQRPAERRGRRLHRGAHRGRAVNSGRTDTHDTQATTGRRRESLLAPGVYDALSARWSPSRPASRRSTSRAPRSPTRGWAAPTSA